MTKFNKDDFSYDGMYLNYLGDYEGAEYYGEGPNVHPSRVGTRKPLFIARFKYRGAFTKARVQKKIMELFSVERYAKLMKDGGTPLGILKDADPEWYYELLYKNMG
tara:strand:- start:215 stop:532 length:318 start_codon:yes stop_codon:yes gene_type:complete